MKPGSKYFDSIRVTRKGDSSVRPTAAPCQWKGCEASGGHRAPKGRGRDGEYYLFCIDHVRQFNAAYNYFQGMSDTEVEDFQKSAMTGHRPTWKLGENAAAAGKEPPKGTTGSPRAARSRAQDPHEFLDDAEESARAPERPRRRGLKPLEKRALDTMHLTETAGKDEIKARFKDLVKRHHPDANGGDRGSEEKLREIIQAYNYLRQAGLV